MRSVVPKNFILFLLILISGNSFSQSSCPENIGFESGNFHNWSCYIGNVTANGGVSVGPSAPINDRHTILQNTFPQDTDPYGNFPVNCPNGSGYSIKLGNNGVQAQAERVSYTFTVPADKNEYSFIYNYAIVFQNPNHLPEEQPKFTSSVYDQSSGLYIACGAFEFVASGGLPGFEISPADPTVYYKKWSPVTVKLVGCAGKTITIEFTTNDCTRGGHFGYAYIDVNENCTSPITGNTYCNGQTKLTLQAPFGFQGYNWYNSDFSSLLGTGNNLELNPIPPVGTTFAVEVVPYPGLGCLDTLYTAIQYSPEAFQFQLANSLIGCIGSTSDLTAPSLTSGSTPNLAFSYFVDPSGLEYLGTPSHVGNPGKYYIKAVNTSGCTETKSITLTMRDVFFQVKNPPENCFPNTIDITDPSLITASDPSLTYTYWKDILATNPLPNPAAVDATGIYFIQAYDGICKRVKPVDVLIFKDDILKTNPVNVCGSIDLNDPSVTLGSASIFTYSFWKDAAGMVPVSDPEKVNASGTYYVKGTVPSGCSFIKPVDVIIEPLPTFSVIDPPEVTAPDKVDITHSFSSALPYSFSFWIDSLATQPLLSPSFISKSGRFFIKAIDSKGCEKVEGVNVSIIVPYYPIIKYPNAFSPNKDGLNDRFRLEIAGNITLTTFKIFNRYGQVVFQTKDQLEYWYGEKNGKQEPVGTYYWVMELVNNNTNEMMRKYGSVTLVR